MIRKRWMAVAGLVLAAAAACEDPTTVTTADLYGLWGAVAMVYTSQADGAVQSDLLISEGATYSIELVSDGTYASQLTRPSLPTLSESGTFEVLSGRLVLSPSGGADRILALEFNQSLLTAREADTEWDFDQDGAMEPASLEMVLDRF